MLAAHPSAAADAIRVGAFDPVPSTAEHGFQLESADIGRAGSWTTIAVLSLATNRGELDANDDFHLISQRAMLQLGAAFALLDRVEVSLRLPLYLQRSDNLLPAADGMALGDFTLHGKGVVRKGPLGAGLALHITLPTSSEEKFTGVDMPSFRMLALLTFRPLTRLTLSFNAGAVLRTTAIYDNDVVHLERGSGLSWGTGASLRLTDRIRAMGEVFGEMDFASERMTDPIASTEGLIGASYRFGPQLTLGAAIGRSISSGLGTFALRGTLTISFTHGPVAPPVRPQRQATDAGGNGALAPEERCPQKANDRNGVRNSVGCLDADIDRDGIPNVLDQCPQQAEDRDGYQDGDGCPELDNDGDGLADAQDRCPLQAESINGIADDDGCPDRGGEVVAHVEVAPDRSPANAAEAVFQDGRKLMKEQQYSAACNAFEQSQRLEPRSGTQYNLANCYVEIGKLATALAMYRELLRTDKNAERRADVLSRETLLVPRVPKLKLSLVGRPVGVSVFMNGTNVNALTGMEVPVDFGSYTIVADAPGHGGWRRTVEIKQDGQRVDIEIDLGPSTKP
jgi:hypothetical protein